MRKQEGERTDDGNTEQMTVVMRKEVVRGLG